MESAEKKVHRVLVDDKTYNVTSVRNGGMGRVWLLEQAFEEPLDPIYKRRIAVKTFDFVSDDRAVERETKYMGISTARVCSSASQNRKIELPLGRNHAAHGWEP